MMGFFVMTISLSDKVHNFDSFGKFIAKIISVIIPRLDLFAKSDWLIYGANINMIDISIILTHISIIIMHRSITMMNIRIILMHISII